MTLKAAVIGDPVEHSLSPLIHNYWLQQFGIAGGYEKVQVTSGELGGFIRGLQKNGYRGCNVTLPHKEAVMEFCDEVSGVAQVAGAVNTIWLEDDKIIGDNSDVEGFIAPLNFTPKVAVVIGAGGAARAVIYGLLKILQVPEIRLVNRTMSRAETLATDLGLVSAVDIFSLDDWENSLAGCELLVNCVSLGSDFPMPDFSLLPTEAVAYDISYKPYETEFLQAASANGLQVIHGLEMLIHQAVMGFCQWFSPPAPPDPTDETLYNMLRETL